MPSVRNHGGGCCGVRHFSGFGGETEREPQRIVNDFSAVPSGRLTEVVLTKQQCRSQPRTMRKLADMGFVLVGGFANSNSGNDCFVFHHASTRRALNDIEAFWPGAVITPTMAGSIGRLKSQVMASQSSTNPARNGQEFTVASPRSMFNGQTFRCERIGNRDYYDRSQVVFFRAAGRTQRIAVGNVRWSDAKPEPKKRASTKLEQPIRHPTQ